MKEKATQNKPIAMKLIPRRELVKKLYYDDLLSENKVAEKLGVSRSTIKSDKKAIAEKWGQEFKGAKSDALIGKILMIDTVNLKRLQKMFRDAEDSMAKTRMIRELTNVNEKLFDKLARLGILATTDNKLELSTDKSIRFEMIVREKDKDGTSRTILKEDVVDDEKSTSN